MVYGSDPDCVHSEQTGVAAASAEENWRYYLHQSYLYGWKCKPLQSGITKLFSWWNVLTFDRSIMLHNSSPARKGGAFTYHRPTMFDILTAVVPMIADRV